MSTSTDDTRAGARPTPTTDPWTAEDEPDPITTDDAPFQFDPHRRSRLPNGCDAANKSTPQ